MNTNFNGCDKTQKSQTENRGGNTARRLKLKLAQKETKVMKGWTQKGNKRTNEFHRCREGDFSPGNKRAHAKMLNRRGAEAKRQAP
jgi:hypothetical protein